MINPEQHFYFRVLGCTFQLTAPSSLKSRIFPRMELRPGRTDADFYLNINYDGTENFEQRNLKWFRMLSGKIAFEDNFTFLSFPHYSIKIEKSGSRSTIHLPPAFQQASIPESVLDLALMLSLREKGYLPLHASGGTLNKSVLFSGKSGCGKSTLIKRLSEIGGAVLSDDHIFLRGSKDGVLAHSYNHDIYLHTDGSESNAEKEVFPAGEEDNSSVISVFFAEVLVFPEFADTGMPRLINISAPEALMRAVPLTLPFQNQSDFSTIKTLCSQCDTLVFELPVSGERLKETKSILRRLLTGN